MKRFTLVELMIVVAIISVLAAIAMPQFYTMQLRSKRVEVPLILDGIRQAATAYDQSFAVLPTATGNGGGYAPRDAVGKTRFPWPGNAVGDWDEMGFAPDGDLYGGYMLQELIGPCPPDHFLLHGVSDVDGAGAMFQQVWCTDKDTVEFQLLGESGPNTF